MDLIVSGLTLALGLLQPALFVGAVVAAGVCGVDWLVRTRRIAPFSPVARFFRSSVDPLLKPMEQRLVRAGGQPAHAPWWMLAAIVVGGIVVLSLVEFVRDQLAMLAYAMSGGAGSLMGLLLRWLFSFVRFALIWRVISSWVGGSPYKPLWKWAYAITEPMLAPLRSVLPAVGPFDVSPIVLFFLLGLVESVLLR